MTAATIVLRRDVTTVPGIEVVRLTASDTNTFVTKFGTVDCVFVNDRSRAGAYASVNGQTITINCASASSDTVDLWIMGH